VGAAIGTTQALIEDAFGYKPKAGWARAVFSFTSGLPVISTFYELVRDGLESTTARKISSETRGKVLQRFQEIKKLRDKYSTAKSNRIIKLIQEEDRKK
jgi:hypothetical protein